MWFSALTPVHQVLLFLSVFCLILSITYNAQQKEKNLLITLFLGAAGLFTLAALLDPFLNLWDERFHGLVAKNMRRHAWMPTLFDDDFMPMKYDDWDRKHIWLHKQPLFLWQIMLSFKAFGVSEFSLRFPSILMGLATLAAIYRSTRLLLNQQTAFYASLMFVSSYYILNLLAGRECTDQNDFTFMGYVSLSLWAFIEYTFKRKKYWVLLIGLFSAAAILTKWLPGLLVFIPWFMYLIKRSFHREALVDFGIALGVTILLALPWQIYILIKFPKEALYELAYNARHFTEVLEGHSGHFFFHFLNFPKLFGWVVALLFVPGCIQAIRHIRKDYLGLYLILTIAFVFLFYSLAATKMMSYPLLVILPVMMLAGSGIRFLENQLEVAMAKWYRWIFGIVLFVAVCIQLRPDTMAREHGKDDSNNTYVSDLKYNKKIFRGLHFEEPTILFNVKGRHYVEAMFYSPYAAYGFIPDSQQYMTCKVRGFKMALFPSTQPIPRFLQADPDVRILKDTLKGFD